MFIFNGLCAGNFLKGLQNEPFLFRSGLSVLPLVPGCGTSPTVDGIPSSQTRDLGRDRTLLSTLLLRQGCFIINFY
jgi:hypothetical protein